MADSDCPSNPLLKQFLDEQLSPAEFAGVSRHLESCARCQSQCDKLTQAQHAPARGDVARQSHPALGQVIQKLIQHGADGRNKNSGVPDSPAESKSNLNAAIDTAFTGSGITFPLPAVGDAPLGRLSGYAILEAVAEGNQGVLYRARDESLKRVVAIKVIHQRLMQSPGAVDRFKREARLIASVQSDHVVHVFQVGQEAGFPPFLIMEFVEGESLRQKLDRRDSLPIRKCAEIVRDTAMGLKAAHQAGLIHRDVKPSNILLDRKAGGRVRLTDFGLAVEETDAVRMTQEGTILGTPAYMSPEQVTRPQSIDSRSDLYSLGVVLYELLSGEVPFRGTVRMTLSQLVHDEARSPRQYNDAIPRDLETICLRAMAKEPSSRFQTAQDLIDELNRWLEGRPILSRPIGRIERAWRWCRRNATVSSLSAMVITLLAVLSVVMTVLSVRLTRANKVAELNAKAALEQSNALLETLGQLIFQLQKQFDRDDIDLNELQRESLQIALAGLRKVRLSTESSARPDLPTAEGLRRLGDLLLQLREYSEARDCLRQAESILRGFLKKSPEDKDAIARLVEVLWSLDDATSMIDPEQDNSEISVPQLSTILKEASDLALRRLKLEASADSQHMAAISLLKHGGDLLQCGKPSEAAATLDECLKLLSAILDVPEQATAEVRHSWLEATDHKYLAMADLDQPDAMTMALEFLKTAIVQTDQFLRDDPTDMLLPVFRLELQDRLATHWAIEADLKPEKRRQAETDAIKAAESTFDELATRLASELREDGDAAFDVCHTIMEVVDARVLDEDDRGAERFLQTIVRIAEGRLEVARDDVDSRGFLAESWSLLADLRAADEDVEPEVVLTCFRKSLEEYKTLSPTSWFDEIDWEDYITTAVSAAELATKLDLPEAKQLKSDAKHLMEDAISRKIDLAPEFIADLQRLLADLQ